MRISAIMLSKRSALLGALLLFWLSLRSIRSLSLSIDDWTSYIPLRCPLAYIFDVSCPTCGLGHSLVAAALGQPLQSWHYHPFGLALFWGLHIFAMLYICAPEKWLSLTLWFKELRNRNPWLLWLVLTLYGFWGFVLR